MKVDAHQEKLNNKKSFFNDNIDIIAFILIAVLFLYFMIFHEVVECGDSYQYANQFPMREPVYSLILQFLQFVAGENYMRALGVVQNLLAIICVYISYRRISDIWKFGCLCRFMSLICLLAPHLLTPLASKTNLILTNTVMTEGITLSLYYVWFTDVIGLLTDQFDQRSKIGVVIRTALLALVLSMTRGQMILCVLMTFVVVVFTIVIENKGKVLIVFKKTLVCLAIFVAILIVKTQATKFYNLAETGNYVNTVSSGPMLLANIAYVCDKNDAEYIKDEDLRDAFEEIVQIIDSEKLAYSYATGNIISRARFHESGHETINFDIIDPVMRKVIYSRYGLDESEFLKLMIYEDELCKSVSKQLLPHIFAKYFKNYVIISMLGFVRSIAVEKSVLPLYALLMYISVITVSVISLKNNIYSNQVKVMIFVLIMICGNVLGTALVIQCITRYMIYNLPFFYMTLIALLMSYPKVNKFLNF